MRRLLPVVLALCASFAFAADANTNGFAAACCRAIDDAAAAGVWRWRTCVRLEPDDAALQDELRRILAVKFPNEYSEALSCSGSWDNPKMRGMSRILSSAFRQTETWQKISDHSAGRGYATCRVGDGVEKPALGKGADGKRPISVLVALHGRMADVTLALRATLRKFRKRNRRSGMAATEWAEYLYEDCVGSDVPAFRMRGYDENGNFKLSCSYGTGAETECAWQARIRELGRARPFAAFDKEQTWQLLAAYPQDFNFEDVLGVLGKPTRSSRLRCQDCGKADMRWTYEITDADEAGGAIRHTLVFSFAGDGRCVRWKWNAE